MKYGMYCMTLLSTGAAYGENIAKWGLDQVFWLVLIAGIAGTAIAFIAKKWVPGILTTVGTAIICVFIKNPTKLSDLGEKLANIIGF